MIFLNQCRKIGIIHVTVHITRAREIHFDYTADWCAVLWGRNCYDVFTKKVTVFHFFQPGIHTFTVYAQHLTKFDITSANCTRLSFSGCDHLTSLYCSINLLEELDLTGTPSVQNLTCISNKLKCIRLAPIACALEQIDCSDNRLTELCFDNCKQLLCAWCSKNNLEYFSAKGCNNLMKIDCSNNKILPSHLHSIIQRLPRRIYAKGRFECSLEPWQIVNLIHTMEKMNWTYQYHPYDNTKNQQNYLKHNL